MTREPARVTLGAADTRRLDFPSGEFDAVIAHTLISHVDDPLAVIRAVRVMKPGGVFGMFDGDYASLTFGLADPTQAKTNDDGNGRESTRRALVAASDDGVFSVPVTATAKPP